MDTSRSHGTAGVRVKNLHCSQHSCQHEIISALDPPAPKSYGALAGMGMGTCSKHSRFDS